MTAWPSIPGETPIDPSGLKRPGIITNRRELNVAEAQNILKVVTKYLSRKPTRKMAPFDYAWTLRLHKGMFGDVWKWAGELRTSQLNIGVPFHQIQPQLWDLLQDLHAWSGYGMNLAEQSARLHHRAVQIHPFQNGNGRWSRMLANIWLKLHGSPLVEWPETTIGDSSTIRSEYLAAVRTADNGDYDKLLELQSRFITWP